MRLCPQINTSSCLDFNLTSQFLSLIVNVEIRISTFFWSYFLIQVNSLTNPKTGMFLVYLTQVHSSASAELYVELVY